MFRVAKAEYKMSDIQRAKQRERRLSEAGISTTASKTFKETQRLINESDLGRSEKRRLREEAARVFLGSGMSSKREIRKAYQEATELEGVDGSLSKMSDAEKARYADASSEVRATMALSNMVGSDTVKFAADALGDDPDVFYQAISDAVKIAMEYPDDPMTRESEINSMIVDRWLEI